MHRLGQAAQSIPGEALPEKSTLSDSLVPEGYNGSSVRPSVTLQEVGNSSVLVPCTTSTSPRRHVLYGIPSQHPAHAA